MVLDSTQLKAQIVAFIQRFKSGSLNRYCGKSDVLWTKGRFSETCCTYEKLVGVLEEIQTIDNADHVGSDEKKTFEYCYHLFESGFWNMFELFNEGDLTLICGLLSAIDSRINFNKIDRVVGIAVGGLPLASLIILGLKNRGIPMSVMSIYPFLKMEPFPRRKERLLVVDTSIQSGFTIRTLADKMGPYLPNVRPKVMKYLVGLSSKTLREELPLGEPEFYDVWSRLVSLAYYDSEKEFNKIKEKPILEDCWTLNLLADSNSKRLRINKYLRNLEKRFTIEQDYKADLPTLRKEIFESKKYERLFTTELTFPYSKSISKRSKVLAKVPIIRLAGFFEKPEMILRVCKALYSLLENSSAILKDKCPDSYKHDNLSSGPLMVIIGGRNAVPFAVCLSLYEMVNCRRLNSCNMPSGIWMTIARRMGTFIPYLSRKKMNETSKILILDAMVKDGVIIKNICDVIFGNQFMVDGQNTSDGNDGNTGKYKVVSLGIFSLTSTGKGSASIKEHILEHNKRIAEHGVSIEPLWGANKFFEYIYPV